MRYLKIVVSIIFLGLFLYVISLYIIQVYIKINAPKGIYSNMTVFDSLNAVTSFCEKDNGKLNGLYHEYYFNGKIKKIGSFINDKRYGSWIEYDSVGNVSKEYDCIYDPDRSTTSNSIKTFENGILLSQESRYIDLKDFSLKKKDGNHYSFSGLLEFHVPKIADSVVIRVFDFLIENDVDKINYIKSNEKIVYTASNVQNALFKIDSITVNSNTIILADFLSSSGEVKAKITYRIINIKSDNNIYYMIPHLRYPNVSF